jgi:uncharacterized protein
VRLRDRLAWRDDGSIRDADIRYLLIRPDSLMGAFRHLDRDARVAALDAFARSLTEHGAKSIMARMRRSGLTPEQLYDDLAASSGSELGWGVWVYRRPAPDRIEVDVANSPFAHGFGPADHPVCAPITGMLTAIGLLVLGRPVRVAEATCAAMAGATCRFVIAAEGEPVS